LPYAIALGPGCFISPQDGGGKLRRYALCPETFLGGLLHVLVSAFGLSVILEVAAAFGTRSTWVLPTYASGRDEFLLAPGHMQSSHLMLEIRTKSALAKRGYEANALFFLSFIVVRTYGFVFSQPR